MSMVNNNKIFILAGESSSDLIGSFIMKGLKENSKELNFFGVGGSNMIKEGLRSVYEINSFNIIGFLNTIYNFKKLNKYLNEIVKLILKEKPKVVITIDTKGFSLALAKQLKLKFSETKFKCPLIHFVPPTIWAYGKSRIKKWKDMHDGLFCLFKKEEDILKKLNNIKNQIIEGLPFDDAAAQYSEDSISSLKGGSLGWVDRNNLLPEFQVELDKGELNTLIGPFKTSAGWHLIELIDKRQKDITEDSRKLAARLKILNYKAEIRYKDWFEILKQSSNIEMINN